jgi:hypothetical protein
MESKRSYLMGKIAPSLEALAQASKCNLSMKHRKLDES